MKFQKLLITIFVFSTILSCKNHPVYDENNGDKIPKVKTHESSLSTVKNLSAYKKTQFIPTLENKISNKKNSIYCATLLFAWDEIRKQINAPLSISERYYDLNLLNKSTSYENVLKSNEYKVHGEIDGDSIIARAEFYKSLPFAHKLKKFEKQLNFDGQNVSSFGIYGNDFEAELNIINIIYYKDDNNFIIKLLPEDKEHEILLYKTDQHFNTIADMIAEIEKLTEIGKTEIKNDKLNWKYKYNYDDKVIIPMFNFNIETNFSSLEGNQFSTQKQTFKILQAWQRTAFILDENGAELESESGVTTEAAAGHEAQYQNPQPKKMIFDKPFLTLLKRTDSKNPYLGLWITNSELMKKE